MNFKTLHTILKPFASVLTIVLCIILFTAKPILAQTSSLDELPLPVLRQKLATSTNDTTAVKVQLAIGHLMLLKGKVGSADIDSAIKFAAQASVLSRRLNYDFGIINAMLLSAETFYSLHDREKGLKIAQNALIFSKMHNNSDGEARSYHLIAQYYPTNDPVGLRNRIFYLSKAVAIFRKGTNINLLSFLLMQNAQLLFESKRTTEGLKLLFEALNLGKGVSRRTVEGIYWNIGRTSMSLGDYTNALKYHFLALKTANEVKDTTMQVGFIKHLIACTYIKLQDYERAIPYSIEVLKMARRYNATYFINTGSSALASEYTHTNQLSKALTILNESERKAYSDLDKLAVRVGFLNCLTYGKHFVQAGRYAQEVKELLAGIPQDNVKELMNTYNSLAYYYSETDQMKLAHHFTELYAAIAPKLNYTDGITMAEEQYYKLVTLKGDPKSVIGHFLKEQEIKDSTDNVVKDYQIFLLEMENETLEKNRHIDSLNREAQINDIKLKRNQLIQKVAIAGSAMLLIITGLIYSRYRLKRRSNALLMKQKSEIDEQNIALQNLVDDKNQLIDEKEWLVKEVHHRVKNNLQMVTSLLYSQTAYLKDDAAVLAVKDSLRRIQAMSLIHQKLYLEENTSTIAMPEYLDDLTGYLNESFDAGNRITFKQNIEPLYLDVSQAIPLGLIVTESIVNAIKYAFQNNQKGIVSISLHHDGDDHLLLKISDNGVGLPSDVDTRKDNSLGISLMKGLARQLHGNFNIENNNGVLITVRFTILNKQFSDQVRLKKVS